MTTVLTTNNGYDTILLVDDSDVVLSRWDVTPETLADYLKDGARGDDWHAGEWPSGFNPDVAEEEWAAEELRTIAAYGRECGRGGVIADKDRREFWGLENA